MSFKVNQLQSGWTKEDIERAIIRSDPSEMVYIPIIISMNPIDCKWAELICIGLTDHSDANIRGNAILGFGHLARTCGNLTESIVRPLIEAGLIDESEYIRGQADSAADDVELYLGWKMSRS